MLVALRVEPPSPWVGDEARVLVEARGGATGEANVTLRLLVDGVEAAARSLLVPVEGGAVAEFPLRLDRPGAHRVEVDGLSAEVRVRVPLVGLPPDDDMADPGRPMGKRNVSFEGDLRFDPSQYHDVNRSIHGTWVGVPVHRGWDAVGAIGGHEKAPPEELAEALFDAFHQAWHDHGGFPLAEVRYVVHGPMDACRFGGARMEGFVLCALDHASEPGDAAKAPHPLTRERRRELLVHEVLHGWVGGAMRPREERTTGFTEWQWFTEGATTYLAARALASEADLSAYEAEMQAQLVRLAIAEHATGRLSFAQHARASASIEAHRREADPHVEALYARGALVSYLLDAELARHGAAFPDLLRVLYRDHALPDQPITSVDVQRAAETAARKDLSAFFDAYVHGAEPVRGPFGFVDHVHHQVRPAPGFRPAGVLVVATGAGVEACAFDAARLDAPPVVCRAADASGEAVLGLPPGDYLVVTGPQGRGVGASVRGGETTRVHAGA